MIALVVFFLLLSLGTGFVVFTTPDALWVDLLFIGSVCAFLLTLILTITRRAAELIDDERPGQTDEENR